MILKKAQRKKKTRYLQCQKNKAEIEKISKVTFLS